MEFDCRQLHTVEVPACAGMTRMVGSVLLVGATGFEPATL